MATCRWCEEPYIKKQEIKCERCLEAGCPNCVRKVEPNGDTDNGNGKAGEQLCPVCRGDQ